MSLKVEKKVNRAWKEIERVNLPFNPLGKYQYIYSNNGKKVSLIKEEERWEILCLKGNLFSGSEKFKSKDDAEEQIEKYLG